MNLTKEECDYIITLLNSKIEKLESPEFDNLTKFDKSALVKSHEKIIGKLENALKQQICLERAKLRRRREKTQKNKTFING